ncbi:ketopantoate reductase family protein [Nocardia sp. NPDC051052]|uniref:ketopantoate reductase family protein n=1 Tax=Nocardia sp. NPDC051052 TaxID=3364322 RepID=UPI0037B74BB9
MRILVVGAGGVGGCLAGIFAAEPENSVAILARGATKQAIEDHGLILVDDADRQCVHRIDVIGPTGTADVFDVVVLCVKTWQLDSVMPLVLAAIGPNTVVVTTENGLATGDHVAETIDPAAIVVGACVMIAERRAPGVFHCSSHPPHLELAPYALVDAAPTSRFHAVVAAFRRAGIDAIVSANLELTLWRKLMLTGSFAGVGALTGRTAGEIRAHAPTLRLLRAAMREAALIARGSGVAVTDEDVDLALGQFDRFPPLGVASMQRDIAAGRPSELFDLSGAIVSAGLRIQAPAPIHSHILESLLPGELRARAGTDAPPLPAELAVAVNAAKTVR